MTFSVVSVADEQGCNEKVVGTIWAEGQAQAQMVASNVCQAKDNERIVVRPVDLREIPLRLPS